MMSIANENSALFVIISSIMISHTDFSFVAERVPSTMFFMGTRHPDDPLGVRTGTQAHNPLFDVDESALPRGAAFYASFALEWAKKGATADGEL